MVDTKRLFVFVLLGMFLISFMSGFVGAADAGVDSIDNEGNAVVGDVPDDGLTIAERFRDSVGPSVTSFSELIFSDTIFGDETLSRIFMSLLVAMFVYTALGSFFSDNAWVHWGATIAATALAMIGLPAGFLESIRLGYGAMGGALLSAIPFLIIFWFTVKVGSLLIARITWLFFGVYYLALYLQKAVIEIIPGGVSFWKGAGPFYILAFVLGVICFFFIARIRQFITHGEMEDIREKGSKRAKLRKTYLATEMERLKADDSK